MSKLVPLALALGLVAGSAGIAAPETAAPAAPPSGATAAPQAEKPAAAEPTSPALLEWIHLCIEHLVSPDERVRAGASIALRSAGNAARPSLESAAANSDPTLSAGAKRVLDQIDRAAQMPRGAEPRRPVNRPGRMSTRIVDSLALDEEKGAAVAKVLDEFEQHRQEIITQMQEGAIERETVGASLSHLRSETDTRIDELLDDDEMARYRQLMQPSPRSASAAGPSPEPDAEPPAGEPPAEDPSR